MREFLKWLLAVMASLAAIGAVYMWTDSDGWEAAIVGVFAAIFHVPLLLWYKDKIDEIFE